MTEDSVVRHLGQIARLLETAGYAIEVDETGAVIIVWLDEWPALVRVKRQKAKGKKQKENESHDDSLPQ